MRHDCMCREEKRRDRERGEIGEWVGVAVANCAQRGVSVSVFRVIMYIGERLTFYLRRSNAG